MNRLFFKFLIISLFVSCTSREQKEKALNDLELTQKAFTDARTEISSLEALLRNNINELEVAKDDLNQVKKFKLLRTEYEREEQIRSASNYIQEIENNIYNINSKILLLKDSLTRSERKIAELKEFLKD